MSGPQGAQQGVSALEVEVVVLLAPAPDAPVGGRQDHAEHLLAVLDIGGQGRGQQADTGVELGDVHAPEPLGEDVHRAGGGEEPGRGDPGNRGLARAVGPQQHPVLPLIHAPTDVAEDLVAAAVQRDVVEMQDTGHEVILS